MLPGRGQGGLCRSARRFACVFFDFSITVTDSFLDNHFINGTKLLNVAGMTRGRRDGILKSEKTRHVVKIGPMHLKGVW